MALNDEIRDEFRRVKKKGRIAILKWYWEYFKIHTLVAVFAVIFVVSTVRSIMNQKPDYVNAIFLNAGGYTLDYNQILTEELEAYLKDRGVTAYSEKRKTELPATTENFDYTFDFAAALTPGGARDQLEMATSQKVGALVASQELDVMAADASNAMILSYQEMCADLRNVFDEKRLAELDAQNRIFYMDYDVIRKWEAKEDQMAPIIEIPQEELIEGEKRENYVLSDKNGMTDPIPVGILLNDSAFFTEYELYTTNAVIGVVGASTKRPEAAVNLLEFLIR